MNKVVVWIRSLLIPVLVGILISLIIAPYMDYGTLVRPSFAPPGFLFPIVWTILYVLMGVSDGILKSNGWNTRQTDYIYYVQLFFNAFWSIFFFVFQWRLFAFLWILLLLIAILQMIRLFYQRSHVAGLLQIPYFIWVIYATILNLSIYTLNR